MRNVYMFPRWVINLQQEVYRHHPELIKKLKLESKQLPELLGILAAEVDIQVDGYYTPGEMEVMGDLILAKLRSRRQASKIILPPGTTG